MQLRVFSVVMFWLLAIGACRGQESPPTQAEGTQAAKPGQIAEQNAPPKVPAAPPEASGQKQAGEEEHHRLFGIFPTYSISSAKTFTPLTPDQKFHIFIKNTIDPYTLGSVAIGAGLRQANNGLAGYGQGAAGYGKRLGAGMADTLSGGFFGTFFFPVLFHQDPRYFRKGQGPFKARLEHALIRAVVTRKDSGGNAFDWSRIFARIATNGLSNAYYPSTDRGAGLVFSRAAIGTALSVAGTVLNEFGPDVDRKLRGRKHTPQL